MAGESKETAHRSCREEDFGCSAIDLVNSIENGASDLIQKRITWVSKYSLDTLAASVSLPQIGAL